MTDATTQTTASKKPLAVYQFLEVEGRKPLKLPFGIGWMHNNGKGCNLDLPLIGRVTVFFDSENNA